MDDYTNQSTSTLLTCSLNVIRFLARHYERWKALRDWAEFDRIKLELRASYCWYRAADNLNDSGESGQLRRHLERLLCLHDLAEREAHPERCAQRRRPAYLHYNPWMTGARGGEAVQKRHRESMEGLLRLNAACPLDYAALGLI